jgi:malate dehydrogenase (oxaloacetate-decarboxylating)(NADP+)
VIKKEEALDYHSKGRKGKIEVVPTKPTATQRDLSMAYTPGVAEPCRKIAENPDDVYEYTAKGNLVAVVSNGTAVLGLGNIGPAAGKPVMEGKGVLFKRFADVDVYDIEVDSQDPKEVIKVCKLLEPTFGGINLEDIKAPECFEIEETLIEELDIPVFHDDQHGTAIISGAALINALELVKKDISEVRAVFCGAGAAGVACANLYIALGVNPDNILMTDSKGVIYKGRTDGMNKYKEQFARETQRRTLDDAMEDADIFVGVAVKDMVTKSMVKSMAKNPIIFAMANPDPEILPEDAFDARKDIIMATGRSDYPNQVNNVLGFPFIFRGALDVHARAINMEMKLAAAYALANLAKTEVPDAVARAYGGVHFHFGPEYIIPKPFDPRILVWEASAVAKAAMDTGVARKHIDIEEYKTQLEDRLGIGHQLSRRIINKARIKPKRIVFPEGANEKILRAARQIVDERIASPVLIGREESIQDTAKELEIPMNGIEIVNHLKTDDRVRYAKGYFEKRQRKGVTFDDAIIAMKNPISYGAMMVAMGEADAMLSGVRQHYPDTIRPALQIIEKKEHYSTVCGIFMLIIKGKPYFVADTTVNLDPTPEQLVDITVMTAKLARRFNVEPKVALLTYSNFGSVRNAATAKVRHAVELLQQNHPEITVDGEMQADTALHAPIAEADFTFSSIQGDANCLIFPNLESGNSAYKLLQRLAGAEVFGPFLSGLKKPVHVLHRAQDVQDIVNMAAIAVLEAASN